MSKQKNIKNSVKTVENQPSLCYNIMALWFHSQVGKASDCNSLIVGSNPSGTSNIFIHKILLIFGAVFDTLLKHAPIAQLDRALDYGSKGCGFDSCWARH